MLSVSPHGYDDHVCEPKDEGAHAFLIDTAECPIVYDAIDVNSPLIDGVSNLVLAEDDDIPPTPGRASFDIRDTFKLHSNPTATKTLYLDFDGHYTDDSTWNLGVPFNTTAFNFEGDANSFTDNELLQIQKIWERIAEDFIPFDVNVTTEEPSIEWLRNPRNDQDGRWGNRIVFGGNSGWTGVNAYGIAHYHSFWGIKDSPAYVFTDQMGSDPNFIACVASHEAGHTMGLAHDGKWANEYYGGHGSGETGWAPIMGTGWHRQLNQWSNGDYSNATTQQDDLAVMSDLSTNGFGYRTDDHGDDDVSASTLFIQSDQGVYDSGIIETNTDVDFFSFLTTGGDVTLNVDPFYRGPNLDVIATLYDAAMTPLATSSPEEMLSASISETLTEGMYYLSVEGGGKAGSEGYSDYGSLGQYTITGNARYYGVEITETDGDTLVVEAGATDTYDISLLNFPTTGGVEFTATADSASELSLDGVTFSPSVVFTTYNLFPTTITVRATDNSDENSYATSTITHAITATAVPDEYPTSLQLPDIVVNVTDDELGLIVDDADPEFSQTNFTYFSQASSSYGDGYYFNAAGSGDAEASWTFTGLEDGDYLVSATWTETGSRATDAPYSIETGGGTLLTTVAMNQQATPGDRTIAGVNWQDVVTVSSVDGTLVVKLGDSNSESGSTVADAVRLYRLGDSTVELSMGIADAQISENGGTTTGVVWRTGGLVGELTVSISDGGSPYVTVPTSVVISNGNAFASFPITGVDDSVGNGFRTVTITASAAGLDDVSQTLQITDNDTIEPFYVDDGDPEFYPGSTFRAGTSTEAFDDDYAYRNASQGPGSATWYLADLPNGTYQVAATWFDDDNHAPDARYEIRSGGWLHASKTVNQGFRPNDFIENGADWEDIGTVTIENGSFSVLLGGSNSGTVVADAIRVLLIAAADPIEVGPKVTGVFVAGAAWTDHFRDSLDAQGLGHDTIARLGFSIPDGGGPTQLQPLPWSNINQITIVFDEHVVVAADDLSLTGENVPNYGLASGGFSYDSATFSATWTFDTAISVDQVTLSLESDEGSGVRSAASGEALDGEWDNPFGRFDTTGDTFASGDDVAGGDFVFSIHVTPGDSDQDGDVDIDDVLNAFGNFTGPQTATPVYDKSLGDGDLDGDGDVDINDVLGTFAQFTGPASDSGSGAAAFLTNSLLQVVSGDGATRSTTPTVAQLPADDVVAPRSHRVATDLAFAELGEDDADDDAIDSFIDPLGLSLDPSLQRRGLRR